ncbi:PepSY domain-containing protein [Micromonospora yangpuensis]|nr:PepSY domain-containing protein [Micromonospora yangpuensis]
MALVLAAVGGTAVLTVTGVALGGIAAGETQRTTGTTLVAAPTPDDATTAPAAPADPTTVPADPTSAPAVPPTGGSADPTATTPAPTGTGSTGAPAGAAEISRERAGEIALAAAGGGRITETESERENGRPVWSVEIVNGDTEHEIDVDRENGSVVKAEKEPVDDDRDHDRDDDRDDDDDDDDRDDD